jgi:hypothetical protein
MIQFNLLPQVKMDYIKAQRMRSLIISVSSLVTAVSIAILVLLLIVDFAQKQHLNSLNDSVASETQTLQQKPDITKILTVQNQLESLTALHSAKPAASRLFSNYLDEITPANIDINDLTIDFNAHTININGTTNTLTSVDQFVDTLKFTTYTVSGSSTKTDAFSDVVLNSFGVNSGSSDATQAATYSINLSYDPTILNITDNVSLSVPNITTTRSELAQPTDLFKAASSSTSTSSSSTGSK